MVLLKFYNYNLCTQSSKWYSKLTREISMDFYFSLFPSFISISFLIFLDSNSVLGTLNFKMGLEMLVRSYDAVCWYEALKQFPNTNVTMFKECGGQAQSTLESTFGSDFEWPSDNEDLEKINQTVVALKNSFEQLPLVKIPKEYLESCSKYLMDPLEKYQTSESDALNDHQVNYPYKGFSFCMINQLRRNHGDSAIDAVKNELTHSHKEWQQTFLDRINEFRSLHNSSQFQLVQNLTDSAQQWADKLAAECKISYSLEADRMYNGQTCGENMQSLWTGLLDDLSTAAYLAADTWYEEVKFYPWKTGFKDDDIKKVDWDLFGKIKGFTQMVWKNSQAVGYGYSFNATCAEMGMESRFVVARYYPKGNTLGMKGTFKQNVKPAGLLTGVVGLVGGLLGGGKKNQKANNKQHKTGKGKANDQIEFNSQNGENQNMEKGNKNGKRERNSQKRNNWGNRNNRKKSNRQNNRGHNNE